MIIQLFHSSGAEAVLVCGLLWKRLWIQSHSEQLGFFGVKGLTMDIGTKKDCYQD